MWEKTLPVVKVNARPVVKVNAPTLDSAWVRFGECPACRTKMDRRRQYVDRDEWECPACGVRTTVRREHWGFRVQL